MKIAHLSDTHLGYRGQGIPKYVEHPWKPDIMIRQWEADLMMGLKRAIDAIIERIQPQLVIHTGDLFDSARPTPHSVDFAMGQIKRLSEAGIPTVLVEGVHSYPRDHTRGHVVQLLTHLGRVTVFCTAEGQARIGDVAIHAVPYVAAARGHTPPQSRPGDATHNVLVAHAVADGHYFYKGHRSAADLGVSECAPWYDYIALGHYHRFAQVPGTECAFYSGATAMVTWDDLWPGYTFGVNVIDLGGQAPVVSRELLETRPMHAYGLDDAHGLSAQDVLDLLERQTQAMPPPDAYCQLIVEGMEPHARRELDISDVEALFAGAASLSHSVRSRTQRFEVARAGMADGGRPEDRYTQIVTGMGLEPALQAEVESLGQDFLERATAQISAEDGVDAHEEDGAA